MKAILLNADNIHEHYAMSLFGLGLSHGLTSGKKLVDVVDDEVLTDRLVKLGTKLGVRSDGEDKFLRQVPVVWDIRAPLFWWSEMDTYKVGTTAQSESTMHTLLHTKEFVDSDFEYPVGPHILMELNRLLEAAKKEKGKDYIENSFLLLKNILPSGWLQRRVWTANYAVVKNILVQRLNHRLPQWRYMCRRFIEELPGIELKVAD